MEKLEPISEDDTTSEEEKMAFTEMLRRVELGRDVISEDPQLSAELEKMIDSLPDERGREIIRRRFFRNETWKKIAEDFGLSSARVRQIGVRALRQLRHPKRMKYVEGVELQSLDKDRYHDILNKILRGYRYDTRVEKNKKMQRILRGIDTFIWGPGKNNMHKLDSLTFNRLCDEIKGILNKKEYSDQDIADLENTAKKLDREVGKVK